jgi:hypothetical protein
VGTYEHKEIQDNNNNDTTRTFRTTDRMVGTYIFLVRQQSTMVVFLKFWWLVLIFADLTKPICMLNARTVTMYLRG